MRLIAFSASVATSNPEILTGKIALPSKESVASEGVKMPVLNSSEVISKFLHQRDFTPQLIAETEHRERRVSRILTLYGHAVVVQEAHQSGFLLLECTPDRKLGLQIDAFDIGCLEAGFGRTP